MNTNGMDGGRSLYKLSLFSPQRKPTYHPTMTSSSSAFHRYSPYGRSASSSLCPAPPRAVASYPTLASMMSSGPLPSPLPPPPMTLPTSTIAVHRLVAWLASSPTLTPRIELVPYLSAHPEKIRQAKAWHSTIRTGCATFQGRAFTDWEAVSQELEEAKKTVREDPSLGQIFHRELAFFHRREDAELRLMAYQIITKVTPEEAKDRGAHICPLPSKHILRWAHRAVESADPLMAARWGCTKDAHPRIPGTDDLVPGLGPSTVLRLG